MYWFQIERPITVNLHYWIHFNRKGDSKVKEKVKRNGLVGNYEVIQAFERELEDVLGETG